MKKLIYILTSLLIISCQEQAKKKNTAEKKETSSISASITINNQDVVKIPNQNFEQALIELKIDSDSIINGQILISDAENCKRLEVNKKSISDLTGIEAFVNLNYLKCSQNDLTDIDISKNTQLKMFYCSDNQLDSLDVSRNTQLILLCCDGNSLGSLDISKNGNLYFLNCSENQLTSLDVSKNTKLTELFCDKNQLTELNVSINTQLKWLDCSDNQLIVLDVRNGNCNHMKIFAKNNKLFCISVDDETVNHPDAVDEGVVFRNDCGK